MMLPWFLFCAGLEETLSHIRKGSSGTVPCNIKDLFGPPLFAEIF